MHENHIALSGLPISVYLNGFVHKVTDKVYHLIRGEIYELGGFKFLTVGGAYSVDSIMRIEGVNWWREEVISNMDYEHAMSVLEDCGKTVDFVVTHTCPSDILEEVKTYLPIPAAGTNLDLKSEDPSCKFLNRIKNGMRKPPQAWYFGHFHIDVPIMTDAIRYRALYNDVIEIKAKDKECD